MDQLVTSLKPSKRINKHIRVSIFEEVSLLSLQTQCNIFFILKRIILFLAKNLAQGFPDWETPKFVRTYLSEAIEKNENQYIRVAGHPNLVKEIARTYGPKLGRELDPLTEVKYAKNSSL